MEHSIFCSELCIVKHANKAKERIEQNRPRSKSSPSASALKTLSRVRGSHLSRNAKRGSSLCYAWALGLGYTGVMEGRDGCPKAIQIEVTSFINGS